VPTRRRPPGSRRHWPSTTATRARSTWPGPSWPTGRRCEGPGGGARPAPNLRNALATFQRLGAAPWAERATAELRATGESARKRDPSAFAQLTPQELQIIRLVGEGGTNREIGAQLFLSRRTIDYHLRNVFVKLGVSSRAELIRLAMADA
jgi:DNA-binding CsgD family transcriptional regulator